MHLLKSVHSSKKDKLLASIACADLLGSVCLDQLGCLERRKLTINLFESFAGFLRAWVIIDASSWQIVVSSSLLAFRFGACVCVWQRNRMISVPCLSYCLRAVDLALLICRLDQANVPAI